MIFSLEVCSKWFSMKSRNSIQWNIIQKYVCNHLISNYKFSKSFKFFYWTSYWILISKKYWNNSSIIMQMSITYSHVWYMGGKSPVLYSELKEITYIRRLLKPWIFRFPLSLSSIEYRILSQATCVCEEKSLLGRPLEVKFLSLFFCLQLLRVASNHLAKWWNAKNPLT